MPPFTAKAAKKSKAAMLDVIRSGRLSATRNDLNQWQIEPCELRQIQGRGALETIKSRLRCKVFMDVNLRSPWWDFPLLEAAMREVDWLKLNLEELHLLQTGEGTAETKMQLLLSRFALEGLVVTCGAQGALAMKAKGELVRVQPEIELGVGAGDAFAAVLLLGIQQAWSLKLTMHRAQTFASALVGRRYGKRGFIRSLSGNGE